MMNKQDYINDAFFQSLIKKDGLQKPSQDFTSKLMARIPINNAVVAEPVKLVGRNLTLLIFTIVGFINLATIYFIWPYLSVWIPENSLLIFIIDQINILISSHISSMIERSATISLFLVITLGITTLIGVDEIGSWFSKT
ncbi:MAG: hypothetical protein B7C24_13075, partial [Bacteroidetes bacterium 4572_77]